MLGFRVWDLGFGVWGLGFGVWGLGFRVWDLGFGVWGVYPQTRKPSDPPPPRWNPQAGNHRNPLEPETLRPKEVRAII